MLRPLKAIPTNWDGVGGHGWQHGRKSSPRYLAEEIEEIVEQLVGEIIEDQEIDLRLF